MLVTGALGIAQVSTIAEKTGKKWAMIQLSFPTDTTSAFPFAGLDWLNFPAYNRFTYRVFRSFAWRQAKRGVNTFRSSLGLAPLRESIFDKAVSDRTLTLYAVSPALLPRPADWHPNIRVTGFLTLPSQTFHSTQPVQPGQSTQPAASDKTSGFPGSLPASTSKSASKTANNLEALSRWLSAGDKPIYIGFGSIPIPDPALFIHVLRELLTRTDHRFLFCSGWSDLPGLSSDLRQFTQPNFPAASRLFITPATDHEWLFPQCNAAIIHGGAGTLAATLRAGVPPIIISIFGDQHWWGKLIEKKSLGRHLPFKQLSSGKLIAAIQSVLSPTTSQHAHSPSITRTLHTPTTQPFLSALIAQNLAVLARQLNREDGLQNLFTTLEQYVLSKK